MISVPRASVICVAEMLDGMGASPREIDFLLNWSRFVDPDLARAIAGDHFPTPLDLVAA